MEGEVIEQVVEEVAEEVVEVVEEPTNLLGVGVEEEVEEEEKEVEEEVKEKIEDEEEVVEDTNVDVEKTLEDFGDLMQEGQLNTILGDFNEGKITGKDLIKKILDEVGIAKDEMEEKIDKEMETVEQNIKDNPIEGVVLKELGGWINKQDKEFIKEARILTDLSLGEDAFRSAVKLLHRVRMGGKGVGAPEVKIVENVGVSVDSLREEYMNIYRTKTGQDRMVGIENLKKKADKTGDKDLIDWAKDFFD